MIDALGVLYGYLFDIFSSHFSYDAYIFEVAFDYALAAFCVFLFFAIVLLPFYIVYRVIDWR